MAWLDPIYASLAFAVMLTPFFKCLSVIVERAVNIRRALFGHAEYVAWEFRRGLGDRLDVGYADRAIWRHIALLHRCSLFLPSFRELFGRSLFDTVDCLSGNVSPAFSSLSFIGQSSLLRLARQLPPLLPYTSPSTKKEWTTTQDESWFKSNMNHEYVRF